MEAISLKLDESMLNVIDRNLKKHNFSTRTEFIRAAIRDKLEGLKKEELVEEFLKLKGRAKKKTTDKEFEKVKEKAFEELSKEKGWN